MSPFLHLCIPRESPNTYDLEKRGTGHPAQLKLECHAQEPGTIVHGSVFAILTLSDHIRNASREGSLGPLTGMLSGEPHVPGGEAQSGNRIQILLAY
jgi:hypothetical protein